MSTLRSRRPGGGPGAAALLRSPRARAQPRSRTNTSGVEWARKHIRRSSVTDALMGVGSTDGIPMESALDAQLRKVAGRVDCRVPAEAKDSPCCELAGASLSRQR